MVAFETFDSFESLLIRWSSDEKLFAKLFLQTAGKLSSAAELSIDAVEKDREAL